MRNNKQFVIIINTVGGVIIQHTNKTKEVDEWCQAYSENHHAIELTIYQRNGLGYEQVVRETKRRIGF